MEELNPKIKDFLDIVLPAAKKELEFVELNDWSIEKKPVRRDKLYKLQGKFNDNNIKSLIQLHKLALEDIKHPEVKSATKLLLKFYEILDARYQVLDSSFNWSEIDIDKEGGDQKAERELEFQSNVRKDLMDLRGSLRDINFGEESNDIDIGVFNNIPVPLMMSEAIEKRFPAITEKLKREDV